MALAVLAATSGCGRRGASHAGGPTAPAPPIVVPPAPGSFAPLVRRIEGAVVNIFAAQVVAGGPFGGYGSTPDPLGGLGRFFRPPPTERIQRSLGTGFLIDAEGTIVTNHHVIERAEAIRVQINDRREMEATVAGSDERTDIALLRIKSGDAPLTGLAAAPLGDSDRLQVGDWVLAIGNPFGLSHTVTFGIVSAKGRTSRDVPLDPAGYYNFIQTDASINPGNSGGPLIDMNGQVVGVNTAIQASGQGISFAIPINMVKTILPQLRQSGRVERSWMGIQIDSLNANSAAAVGLRNSRGALVVSVTPEGPAARAGMRLHDVILEFDGHSIQDASELPWLASTAGVGHVATLRVFRDRTERTMRLTLARMRDE